MSVVVVTLLASSSGVLLLMLLLQVGDLEHVGGHMGRTGQCYHRI